MAARLDHQNQNHQTKSCFIEMLKGNINGIKRDLSDKIKSTDPNKIIIEPRR